MIASIEPINSGFAITDYQDPRAQYYLALRQRFGKLLHEASVSLRQQGEENTVDSVYALVSWLPSLFLFRLIWSTPDTVHPNLFTGLWRQQR
jgi:proteasome activator subunit 4